MQRAGWGGWRCGARRCRSVKKEAKKQQQHIATVYVSTGRAPKLIRAQTRKYSNVCGEVGAFRGKITRCETGLTGSSASICLRRSSLRASIKRSALPSPHFTWPNKIASNPPICAAHIIAAPPCGFTPRSASSRSSQPSLSLASPSLLALQFLVCFSSSRSPRLVSPDLSSHAGTCERIPFYSFRLKTRRRSVCFSVGPPLLAPKHSARKAVQLLSPEIRYSSLSPLLLSCIHLTGPCDSMGTGDLKLGR